ncbi:MAG TPA: VCBS repeat-containing protein [Thermoanaerobaculia bacterium]
MKWTPGFVRRRLVPALLLGALALAAGAPVRAAAAKPPKAAPPKKAEKGKKTAAAQPPASRAAVEDEMPLEAPAAPAAGGGHGPQPPDGKWLKDEEGRLYFLEKLEKAGAPYLRLDAKTVRTRWGITIDVAKEDEKYFYYKVYRAEGSFRPEELQPQASAEEKAKILASYAVEVPESRRLSFAPFGNGLPNSGQWRNGFDIADMNGDGHLDIVHPPARKSLGNPVIFLGDGKGNWRRWSEAKYPRLPFDYGDAAAADFNGDGHMDFALGMHLRGLAVLLGDGKGNFTDWGKGLDLQVPKPGNDGAGFSSRAIAAIDWNHDGRPDILALGEGPRLNVSARDQPKPSIAPESYGAAVYLNQGDGTWVRKDQGTSSREVFGDAVAVGDFNGDRRKDFATGSNTMGRQTLVNYAREDGAWNPADLDLVRPQSYIRSVAAGDFNGDGRDDLAVGYLSYSYPLESWRSGIDVLFSRADGTWTRRPLASEEGRVEVSSIARGDLDGDGRLDLVALTGEGETWVFLGDGKGFFTREAATGIAPFAGRCRGYHVQLADLDGDGKDEFVSGFAGENSPMFDPDLCLSGGGLQAWRAAPGAGGRGC